MWRHYAYLATSVARGFSLYRNLPIKGASPNKGAPYSLEEPSPILAYQNQHSFFNNCPIFNPKPPFESLEPQLCLRTIRCDLARAPGALIRQNTVFFFHCHIICYQWRAILTKVDSISIPIPGQWCSVQFQFLPVILVFNSIPIPPSLKTLYVHVIPNPESELRIIVCCKN